ncbi:hypothetical protein K435DRAFT_810294 [Dendrothele bispora CBS 962.96]|uniref:Uncharacterized protein n=1 Tax=Dendrothele bispora (strain CBS 962.96) TaxID=1314807 RepID=A0A4V4HBM4_DENBC|nr:hypothetical protein K435DRAFT_810294 [Dendrothele bispora CBS 962.96]
MYSAVNNNNNVVSSPDQTGGPILLRAGTVSRMVMAGERRKKKEGGKVSCRSVAFWCCFWGVFDKKVLMLSLESRWALTRQQTLSWGCTHVQVRMFLHVKPGQGCDHVISRNASSVRRVRVYSFFSTTTTAVPPPQPLRRNNGQRHITPALAQSTPSSMCIRIDAYLYPLQGMRVCICYGVYYNAYLILLIFATAGKTRFVVVFQGRGARGQVPPALIEALCLIFLIPSFLVKVVDLAVCLSLSEIDLFCVHLECIQNYLQRLSFPLLVTLTPYYYGYAQIQDYIESTKESKLY